MALICLNSPTSQIKACDKYLVWYLSVWVYTVSNVCSGILFSSLCNMIYTSVCLSVQGEETPVRSVMYIKTWTTLTASYELNLIKLYRYCVYSNWDNLKEICSMWQRGTRWFSQTVFTGISIDIRVTAEGFSTAVWQIPVGVMLLRTPPLSQRRTQSRSLKRSDWYDCPHWPIIE